MWKDNVYFILVEPREPGNIGSAARAIKNMGFKNLEMVNPADYHSGETRRFAHQSMDILKRANIYDSFGEAIRDKAIVVGTTRRTGKIRGLIYPLHELARRIPALAKENKVAFVFGREDRGLTNEEIKQCGYLATIPSDKAQPSLNLAQAVLIVAYELSRLKVTGSAEKLVRREEMLPLYERINGLIQKMGYLPRGSRDLEKGIMKNIRSILGRSGLTDWEARMIIGLCSRIEEIIAGKTKGSMSE